MDIKLWIVVSCLSCVLCASSSSLRSRTYDLLEHDDDDYTVIQNIEGFNNQYMINFVVHTLPNDHDNFLALVASYGGKSQKYAFMKSPVKKTYVKKSTYKRNIAPSIDLLLRVNNRSTTWIVKASRTGEILHHFSGMPIPGTIVRMKIDAKILPTEVTRHHILNNSCGRLQFNGEISINLKELCNATVPGLIPKIIHGKNAEPGHYPWQVGIWDNSFYPDPAKLKCGGTLISPCGVLTAAHCVGINNPVHYFATVGSYYKGEYPFGSLREIENPKNFSVSKIITHEQYVFTIEVGYPKMDIALFALTKDSMGQCVAYGAFVQPVCLPTMRNIPKEGETCRISGWGATEYDSDKRTSEYVRCLQAAEVQKYGDFACNRSFGSIYESDTMLCALGIEDSPADTCQGDSGGPLTCEDVNGRTTIEGITSFGRKCGEPTPGVYTRVKSFVDWIYYKYLIHKELRVGL